MSRASRRESSAHGHWPGWIGRQGCRLLLVLLALQLASILPLTAQTTTSTLKGLVRRADGLPVAGAKVIARSAGVGLERRGTTDTEGRFRIDLLPPGEWMVLARLGEETSRALVVGLRLQAVQDVELVLEEGPVEEMTVDARTPLLDPSRMATELRVSREQSEELPVAGRDASDLARLDSSVRTPPPGNFFGERGTVFVVNGQTGRSNSYLVDGLDNNDQTSGTTLNAFFSQQVIREFVVLKSQYAPEFGRASGGILNIITERGDNTPRGGFFLQGVPADWNGSSDFLHGLEAGQDQDADGTFFGGFHAAGPIRKDRSYYFLAYEHQDQDRVIPWTGVDRDGLRGGWTEAPAEDDNLFLRFDANLGERHLFMARLSADDRSTSMLNVGGVRTPESGFHLEEKDLQLATTLTTVVDEWLQNEARFLFGHSSFDQFANSDRPGVSRPSGIFGGNNLNRQLRDEDRFQFVDNVTFRSERHTMKFGFDLIVSSTEVDTRFNPNGNFLYDTDAPFEPGDCGDLLASDVAQYGDDPIPCPGVPGVDDDGDGQVDEPGLISTYPVAFQLIQGQPRDTFDDTRLALFAQDSWQVSPRWHLTYGLRYDVSSYELPGDARVDSIIPNGGAERDTDDIAPRIGFTFRPRVDGPWLLRGGAGLFYDKLVLAFPAVAAVTSGTRIGLIFPQGLTLELTEDTVEELGIDTIRQGLVFPENLVLRFSTATQLETPYTVQASLGAERALGRRGLFRVNAIRALGYHAPLMVDLNPVEEISPLGIPVHRDPDVGSIAAITTEGRRWYTGVDLGFQWRGDSAWASASYTWSRTEDMGPDPLKGGIYLPPQSDDLFAEKARADADRRHRFVLSGSTRLPWLGLHASGVFQVASGAPFNVTTGGDENRDGIATDRPAHVPRNSGEDTPLGPVNELRAEAGLPPVEELKEPSFSQLDLRLWRPFTLGDGKARGQVFLQVFNVLDEFNGGPVEGRVTSRDFGRAIGLAGPPRTWEMGFRLAF